MKPQSDTESYRWPQIKQPHGMKTLHQTSEAHPLTSPREPVESFAPPLDEKTRLTKQGTKQHWYLPANQYTSTYQELKVKAASGTIETLHISSNHHNSHAHQTCSCCVYWPTASYWLWSVVTSIRPTGFALTIYRANANRHVFIFISIDSIELQTFLTAGSCPLSWNIKTILCLVKMACTLCIYYVIVYIYIFYRDPVIHFWNCPLFKIWIAYVTCNQVPLLVIRSP